LAGIASAGATVSGEIVMVGLLVQVSTATMPRARTCAIEQSLLNLIRPARGNLSNRRPQKCTPAAHNGMVYLSGSLVQPGDMPPDHAYGVMCLLPALVTVTNLTSAGTTPLGGTHG
jgi:hypothetical protein